MTLGCFLLPECSDPIHRVARPPSSLAVAVGVETDLAAAVALEKEAEATAADIFAAADWEAGEGRKAQFSAAGAALGYNLVRSARSTSTLRQTLYTLCRKARRHQCRTSGGLRRART